MKWKPSMPKAATAHSFSKDFTICAGMISYFSGDKAFSCSATDYTL